MEGWVGLSGWLHTEISVLHRELNPDTVTHSSTNRARHRLTSLIETYALLLRETATATAGTTVWNIIVSIYLMLNLHEIKS